MGKSDAPGRGLLITATERLIEKEGYAGVTASGVAEEAGLRKSQVFYYFADMNELILETFKRQADVYRCGAVAALSADQPLRQFWNLQRHRNSRLFSELMLMASRNDDLRKEIVRTHADINEIIERGISSILENNRDIPLVGNPKLLVFLISSVARSFATETDLGMLQCPAEFDGFIEWFLERFERDGEDSRLAVLRDGSTGVGTVA